MKNFIYFWYTSITNALIKMTDNALIRLGKSLRLPTPKELGWSEYNALESELFPNPNTNTARTWEAYEHLMRETHPIKAFFYYDFTKKFWWRVVRHINDAWYWLQCHILPSRRYHIIDIRKPKFLSDGRRNPEAYSYGWIDSDHKMTLALFTILEDFVKNEMPGFYCPPEDDTDNARQRKDYLEIMEIYNYWTKERIELQLAYDAALTEWCKYSERTYSKTDTISELELKIRDREDEMLYRLLKVRHAMWT